MCCPKRGASSPEYARLYSRCGQPQAGAVSEALGQPADRPPTSGLAIAALLLGILSPFTCMLTALPAIIMGIIALVNIRSSRGTLKGLCMAIAGVALAALGMLILLGLGVVMPLMIKTHQAGVRVACRENLVAMGKAMRVYASEHEGRFPTPSIWCDLLVKHGGLPPKTFRCRDTDEGPCNYAMNAFVQDVSDDLPGDIVLLFETSPGWNQAGASELVTTNHHQGDGLHVLLADGHVEWVWAKRLSQLRWTSDGPAGNSQPSDPM